MKTYFPLLLGLAFCYSASAQGDETIANKFDLDVSGAWGGWNSQLTSLGDENAFMQGGFGGLEFNKTIFVGWSLYKLQDAVIYQDDLAARQVDLRYHGPFITYTPYARKVVHPKLGLQAGFGKVRVNGLAEDKIAIIQPTAGGEINVLRWLRLGADVGYRFALNTASNGPNDDFVSGFFGQATLKLGFSWGTSKESL